MHTVRSATNAFCKISCRTQIERKLLFMKIPHIQFINAYTNHKIIEPNFWYILIGFGVSVSICIVK